MADPDTDESTTAGPASAESIPAASARSRTSVPSTRAIAGRRRPSQGDGFLRLIFGITAAVTLVVLWAVARLIGRS